MAPKAADAKTLKRYLLGELSQEEQEALESWLLSDQDSYDLLSAAEDDLIDDSLAGKLNPEELDKFHNHFLAAPERQKKLQFGQALRRYLNESQVSRQPAPTSASLWDSVAAYFRLRPAFGSAAAAALILTVAGGIWSGVRVVQLKDQLNSTSAQVAEIEQQREQLQRQVDASARAAAQFEFLKRAVADLGSSVSSTALLTLQLSPTTVTRSVPDEQTPKATLGANTRFLKLSLTFSDEKYSNYSVVLTNDGDEELWRMDDLKAVSIQDGKAVDLIVPANYLPDGDYRLKVMGASDPASTETLGNYLFRAQHAQK